MSRLIFVDAGVLIAAARGKDEFSQQALEALDDPDVVFASSPFVKLEVLPKSIYHKRREETEFYEAFFNAVSVWATPDSDLLQKAYDEAIVAGLSAIDALHVVAAAVLNADELITLEKVDKPIHRTKLLPVRTIVRAKAR